MNHLPTIIFSGRYVNFQGSTRVSMEVSNLLVSWFITHLRDLQPTYKGVIIHSFTKYHGHPSRLY